MLQWLLLTTKFQQRRVPKKTRWEYLKIRSKQSVDLPGDPFKTTTVVAKINRATTIELIPLELLRRERYIRIGRLQKTMPTFRNVSARSDKTLARTNRPNVTEDYARLPQSLDTLYAAIILRIHWLSNRSNGTMPNCVLDEKIRCKSSEKSRHSHGRYNTPDI